MAVTFSPVYECAMNGLSKSDRGEPGGLHGGGGFIWAFRAPMVFSTGREPSQEDGNRGWVF